MGRRKKEMAQMGRAIIKDFRGKKPARGGESFRHTAEMNDGNERGILSLQSVTEQSSLGDFLATAEMAGRSFKAEKENVQIVTPEMNNSVLSKEKLEKIKAAQDLYKSLLRIPRRPPWKKSTTADQLKLDEQSSFVEWRRLLSRLQEEEHIVITPYEKNLEFWRQLWRVLERSDVVVQIVDARNPLLFWCPDLDKYVKEVDPKKQTLLLINKADLLTANQRQAWGEYFAEHGVNVVFWSAVEEAARIQSEKAAESETIPTESGSELDAATERLRADDVAGSSSSENGDDDKDETAERDDVNLTTPDCEHLGRTPNSDGGDDGDNDRKLTIKDNNDDDKKCDKDEAEDSEALENDTIDSDGFETEEEYTDDGEDTGSDCVEVADDSVQGSDCVKLTESSVKRSNCVKPTDNIKDGETAVKLQVVSSDLQTSEELLELFRTTAQTNCTPGVTTVGMVGYPNVGKSSTINTILQTKKVPVSATPGRTKHFQTLYVEKDLMLCDCPGLVFPSFVNSKAELVVNGILPIDQLQDCDPPVALVCERAGRAAFEGTYHINLPPPEKWEDPDKPPSAYDLLQAYGLLRGFMSHKGNPDRPRAARYILKDYVNGKLLFCHPPPGIDAAAFQKPPYAEPRVYKIPRKACTQKTELEIKSEALDREFFAQTRVRAHAKGPHAVNNYVRTEGLQQVGLGQGQGNVSAASTPQGSQASIAGKPWKRHNNRNKKEKLRRLYSEHDRY